MKVALKRTAAVEAEGNMDLSEATTVTGGLSRSKDNERVLNHILISGIAENKMAYGIREIMANAWDANRDTPFTVHLPSQSEPWFSVRDYGPGISPTAYSRYVMLGDSSKRNNNNVVGAFGLGAKAPFAYLLSSNQTPEYTVTSTHKGIRRTYLHGLTDEFAPTATLVAEEPTDEPSGLEVSWTVLPNDIRLFLLAYQTIRGMFPPGYRGDVDSKWDSLIDGVEVNHRWLGAVYVRMGCIGYQTPLNNHRGPSLLIDVPIGSCSITASREELAWDDATRDYVTQKYAEVKDAITQHLVAEIEKAPDRLQGLEKVPHNLRSWVPLTARQIDNFEIYWGSQKPLGVYSEKTRRLPERALSAGVSRTTLANPELREKLTEAGFNLIDLDKIVLPPRQQDRLRKGGRLFLTATGETEIVYPENLSDVVYVVAVRSRYGKLYSLDSVSGYRESEEQVIQIVKDLKIEGVVIVRSNTDKIHDEGTPLLNYIRENTTPGTAPVLAPSWVHRLDKNAWNGIRTLRNLAKHRYLSAAVTAEAARIREVVKKSSGGKEEARWARYHPHVKTQPTTCPTEDFPIEGVSFAQVVETCDCYSEPIGVVKLGLEYIDAQLQNLAGPSAGSPEGENALGHEDRPTVSEAA